MWSLRVARDLVQRTRVLATPSIVACSALLLVVYAGRFGKFSDGSLTRALALNDHSQKPFFVPQKY